MAKTPQFGGPAPAPEPTLAAASGFERLAARAARAMRRLGPQGAQKLAQALASRDAEGARALALSGARLDDQLAAGHESPMQKAAQTRGAFGASAVAFFLSLGGNPDKRVWDLGCERGLATSALRSGQWEGARLLAQSARKPLARDADGLGLWGAFAMGRSGRAWRRATGQESSEASAWIASLGADPNEALEEDFLAPAGATPLWLAAASEDAVAELIKAGAHPNPSAPPGGVTPLMRAAFCNNSCSIQMLLGAGADPLAVDGQGRDAMWCLMRGGDGGWRSDGGQSARMLLDAGIPSLGRSRFEKSEKMSDFPVGMQAVDWVLRLRAVEEGHALEQVAGPAGPSKRRAGL